MATKVAYTKANLIKSKSLLDFSHKGFELLDKKRNVLIREMMQLIDDAKRVEAELGALYSKAYQAIEYLNITMGADAAFAFAEAVELESDFKIRQRSVMGVEIPEIIFQEQELEPSYGFFRSNPSLDIAIQSFQKVKYLNYQLAELESGIFKLAEEIKKTQKRANSLEKIQIPKFTKQVKEISSALEEKEREDFFRLKRVKAKKK